MGKKIAHRGERPTFKLSQNTVDSARASTTGHGDTEFVVVFGHFDLVSYLSFDL